MTPHPALKEGEAVHVAGDVYKASYTVALHSAERRLLTTWVDPTQTSLIIERRRPVQEGIAQVVYETGPTDFGLARQLRSEG